MIVTLTVRVIRASGRVAGRVRATSPTQYGDQDTHVCYTCLLEARHCTRVCSADRPGQFHAEQLVYMLLLCLRAIQAPGQLL